jgi:integrase
MQTLTLDVGLRNFEVCGLSFEDLDRVGQRIHIKGKKHHERWLPVSPQTWRVIDCYLAVRTSSLEHVFVTDDGLRPIIPATLNRQLGRILTDLGLVDHITKEDPENPSDMADEPRDAAGLCWQALRRTFATFYVASGRTEDELRAMMGWSREYAHAVRERYIARRTVTQLQSVHANSTIVNTLFRSH